MTNTKNIYTFTLEQTPAGINTHFTSGEDQQGDTIEVLDAIMIMNALKTMVKESGVKDEQLNEILETMMEVPENEQIEQIEQIEKKEEESKTTQEG